MYKMYAQPSALAQKFINSEFQIARNELKPAYEYLSAGANLSKAAEPETDKIHKYLSPSAIENNVNQEFGKYIDITI